uniref:Large ribosomal subunit protein uL23 N-terminal domain-containing protein n=1 Tax=Euplotes harpa TaxID=151035 RepID=A0A7S3N4S3_9SPIT|mmetsp:Transcript_11021/g.12392  ORF Transcript_11021/g.12392 Transcript_11021/m.12392 type:complete len:162 (+) Transcript_11021:56-541(+)
MGRPPRATRRVKKVKKSEQPADQTKATKARAVLKKGTHLKSKHKVWTTATFRRPKTLALKRTPKYERKSAAKAGTVNKYKVIQYPLVGESASKLMEDQNTLVFIVSLNSTKTDIKRTFKQRFEVDVRSVNTLIRPDGKKKAFVTLKGDQAAVDLGSKIGII